MGSLEIGRSSRPSSSLGFMDGWAPSRRMHNEATPWDQFPGSVTSTFDGFSAP